MNINGKSDKIKNALIWSLSAEFIAKMIVPMNNMIIARILTPNDFGIVATINMVIGLADMISNYGISKYIVQHEFTNDDELYKNTDVAFWTNVGIAILCGVLITIFSPYITKSIGKSGYELALIITAISLPLSGFSSVQESLFQRVLNFKALFYRRMIVSLVPLFITVPLAYWGWGYWALIIGILFTNVLKIIVLSFYSLWKPSLFYNFHLLKQMFSFGFWMTIIAISSWGVYYVDIFFVSKYMDDYYTGLYSNSQITVTGIISIITASTSSVLFSSLSREQNNILVFRSIFYNFQKKIGLLILPLGVGIFCFSDLITIVLLGKQWMEASKFIGMWGLSTVLFCLFADFSKLAFNSKGNPKIIFYIQLVQLFFLIIVCNYAVKEGFYFLGIIRSVANIFIIFIYLFALKKFFSFSLYKIFFNLKIPFICSIIMGIFAKFLLSLSNDYQFQVLYVIFSIILYFFLLSFFEEYRIIIIDSLNLLKNKWLKFN